MPLAVNSFAHFALSWRRIMQVTAEPLTAHWMFLLGSWNPAAAADADAGTGSVLAAAVAAPCSAMAPTRVSTTCAARREARVMLIETAELRDEITRVPFG